MNCKVLPSTEQTWPRCKVTQLQPERYLNFGGFIVHPEPFEIDHEIDLKGLLQFDTARGPQDVGQVDALAVALVSAWDIFDPRTMDNETKYIQV